MIHMTARQLQDPDERWNVFVEASISSYPTGDTALDNVLLVFRFYNEMESGGYEALMTWEQEDMQRLTANVFFTRLASGLEMMGAQDLANSARTHGEKIYALYHKLEAQQIEEQAFYDVVREADAVYVNADVDLGTRLAHYLEQHAQDYVK